MGRLSVCCSAAAGANSGDGRGGIFRTADHAVDRFASDNDVDVVYRNDEGACYFFGRDDRKGRPFPEGVQDGFGNSIVMISVEDACARAFGFFCTARQFGRQARF